MTLAPDRSPLTFTSIDDVARALREAGHRVSAPARQVLEALFAADGPVSAERIATDAGSLDLTSVYRNLERLEQLGIVGHVHLGHGPGLYVLARGGDREYIVCDRCGRVRSVEPSELEQVRRSLRRSFGYEVKFSHFPIHGRCAGCREAVAAGASPVPIGGHMHEHEEGHEHDHDEAHAHEHEHGDESHSHTHTEHDHEHTEHEHEHSHGDRVHSHPHAHEAGLEHEHEHEHE